MATRRSIRRWRCKAAATRTSSRAKRRGHDEIKSAGFPGAFVHAFFTGSLLIENIFSLDGLGLLSFESILNRDYPVVFGTLFAFGLLGLVVGILSDLMYVWTDPRIDFERRE